MNLWIPICLVKHIFIATFTSIVSSIMIKMFKAMMPQEFFSVVEWLIEFLPSPSLPLFTPILSLPFNCTIIFTEGNRLSWTYCWDQLNQRSISQRCKGRLFINTQKRFLNNQIRLKRRDAMRHYTTCKWESYARVPGYRQKFIQRWIFFHSLHRLKKLMYFSFSHHVPIFTSNWESRAPTDQWSLCRAYVNTKSLEELWQLSWNYIPEIHSVVSSNHLYS